MFFIVGTGRCGTQMMRKILDAWPDVKIVPETHFIIPLYDAFGIKSINTYEFLEVVDKIYGANGKKWVLTILADAQKDYHTYKSEFLDYAELYSVTGGVREYTEAFFQFLYGSEFVFGDKTPHYGTNLEIIRSLWPRAKIIHLTRDGIDCALSMRAHPGFIKLINGQVAPEDVDRKMYKGQQLQFSNETPNISAALDFWVAAQQRIIDQILLHGANNVLSVKYENILLNPRSQIFAIAEYLGINHDSRALARGIRVPKPFPEKHQIRKLDAHEYEQYFEMVKGSMTYLGYPYQISIDRTAWGRVKELYRGRYSYLKIYARAIKAKMTQFKRN